MLIFGIVLTSLGALLPSLIDKFGIDKVNAGALMSLMSIGILLGSLVFGPIVDRYGYKNLLIICSFLILIGLEGIAYAPSFWILRVAVFGIGLGGGVINGGTNALVADISEKGRGADLSILGIFFGIGAIGIPLVLGLLGNRIPYENFIAVVGGIVLIPIVFFLSIRFPAPKQIQGLPIKEGLGLIKKATLVLASFDSVLYN